MEDNRNYNKPEDNTENRQVPPQQTQGGYNHTPYSQQNNYNPPPPPPYHNQPNRNQYNNQYSQGYNTPPTPPQQKSAQPPQQEYKWDFDSLSKLDEEKKPRKKNKGLRVFAGLVACVAFVFFGGFGAYGIWVATTGETGIVPDDETSDTQSSQSSEAASLPSISITPKPDTQGVPSTSDTSVGTVTGELALPDLYDLVTPSVVGVVAYQSESLFGGYSEGSGIIMSEDGYIITNEHVVEGGAMLEVVLHDGSSYPAVLVGADVATDLAVLKIDASGLVAAEFGDSDDIRIGETVVTMGNPGGLEFAASMAEGIVSGLDRKLSLGDAGYTQELIQTTAAVNPGNSGGALVNAYGQVVGVNRGKIADVDFEGMGFAIPITDAMDVVNDIIENGQVTDRPMLGITAEAITPTYAAQTGTPIGLYIHEFTATSSLPAAGVQVGDIITHIDDYPVYSVDDISQALADNEPGDEVKLTVFRRNRTGGGEVYHANVTLISSAQ